MEKVKIGIIGVGHLGRIHLKLAKDIPSLELVGFYDPDDSSAQKAIEETGAKRFASFEELLDAAQAIDIVTPTLTHHAIASKAIKASKHVFIEKPVTQTVEEARSLLSLANEAEIKAQVGHVERFNPAFLAAKDYCSHPMFIETHRLAQFNPRGTDVSVVLDLMIHDIDIVLSVVRSNIRRISASGVSVVSDTPDITNARIEFDNGCVANLTASRISMKNMRKTRLFQRDAYISIDFLEKEVSIIRLKEVVGEADPLAITIDPGNGKPTKQIYFESPKVDPINAIRTELELFAQSILTNSPTPVTLEDGLNALEVAHRILEKMQMTSDFPANTTIS